MAVLQTNCFKNSVATSRPLVLIDIFSSLISFSMSCGHKMMEIMGVNHAEDTINWMIGVIETREGRVLG